MTSQTFIPVRDYDLAATLASGQAFRWKREGDSWEGVIAGRWVRLHQSPSGISATTAEPVSDWSWLTHYLQTDIDLASVIQTFPDDEPLRCAVGACRGLRLLRQEPWECLASFVLSSTKQIVQIQQIVRALCQCFGNPVAVPPDHVPEHCFPTAQRIAVAGEAELRACKMGFRAPNLSRTAKIIAAGELDLQALARWDYERALGAMVKLPGVGEKIANCVLLFAYGFQEAFPVDVWVRKALIQLYFPRRCPSPGRLSNFTRTYFGAYSGYAQQYLFHYMRTGGLSRKKSVEKRSLKRPQ